ncbi:MAG: glycerophosphodiester phosphodiesterase [Gemmobacter sp.]
MTHPFLDHPLPIAFAHRGGGLEAEENTLAAFRHAAALGYRHFETDVQVSRDGVAVIFHDDTLDRIAGRPERVDALDWAELRDVRTKAGNGLLRLDEMLDAFPGHFMNLEAKSDAAVQPIADAIRRAGALDRVCAGSFEARRTAELRRILGPGLCWSPAHGGVLSIWLAGFGLPVPRPGFRVVQVPPLHFGIPVVTSRFVAAARARGVHVHVWTVDERAEMERLIDLGVDGIMTDRPTVLKEVLTARGLWRGA